MRFRLPKTPIGTVSNQLLYDPCTGSGCGTTSFRQFLQDWAAPEVFNVFVDSGELASASASVSWRIPARLYNHRFVQ